MVAPYLSGEPRQRFDAWLDGAIRRYSPPLAFREIRKGVQALSALWVEGRQLEGAFRRATEGSGKRAALASYYAPLHFLAVWHALAPDPGLWLGRPRRVLDWGCGTGPTGAALAARSSGQPTVLGLDVSGWALGEARCTLAAFGLRGRTRRASLPLALPQLRRGDLIALGWVVNELGAALRAELLETLRAAAGRGAGLFLAEPLSRRVSPWWAAWVAALVPLGARENLLREERERPDWIAALDRAAGLDHRVIGARVLALPADPA